MENIPSDPIRAARRLFTLCRQENDPGQIIKYASDLRFLGRPDLSIAALDILITRFGPSKESLAEQAQCCEALGDSAGVLEVATLLRKVAPTDFDTFFLELKQVLRQEGKAISEFDYRDIIKSIQNIDDFKKMLAILSLAKLPVRYIPGLSRVLLKFSSSMLLSFSARYLYANLKVLFAVAFSACSFSVLRLLTAKQNIYFASLGKFTRLADLVDGVDPLIRKLNSNLEASPYRLFVFFFGGYPNRQLFEMYQRHCTFLPTTNCVTRKLAQYFIELLRIAGRHTEITVDYSKINLPFLQAPSVISFTATETRALRKEMECVGIDPGRPFICFGLRDMAYYQFYGDVMSTPLAEQGRRSDTHHRCPPLDAYIHFAQFWAQRGYQVVRMGLRVSESLPKGIDPMIIDYASGNRSDALDAFLFAHCWFLTAGDTGLFSGAAAFDRPAVVSDLFLIRNTIYSSNKKTRNIFVPKLIYDVREGRYLSFREQIYFNGLFSYHDDCDAAGFKIVHNAPDDIIDASLELVGRLAGVYETSQEDNDLQKAFHKIYAPSHVGYGSTGIVSSKFLRKYSYLLD